MADGAHSCLSERELRLLNSVEALAVTVDGSFSEQNTEVRNAGPLT